MNTHRITISLPHYLYQQLTERIQPGKISPFIARVLENEIVACKVDKRRHPDPIDEFLSLGRKLPQRTTIQILKAIHRGRT